MIVKGFCKITTQVDFEWRANSVFSGYKGILKWEKWKLIFCKILKMFNLLKINNT